MRTFAQILFYVFYIVCFSILLTSVLFKFAFFNYEFWAKSFEKHSVYYQLTNEVKQFVNAQVNKQGGNANDVSVITDLITETNTKDFINHNLKNILSYVNGSSSEMKVYVPLNKLPKNLLPQTAATINQEMTLKELSERFKITGLENLPLEYIYNIGYYNNLLFIVSAAVSLVVLIILVLLVAPGKKFISPAVAVLSSGLILLGTSESLRRAILLFDSSTLNQPQLNQTMIRTILSPAFTDLIKAGTIAGVAISIIGVFIFFISKWGGIKDNRIPLN